MVTIEKMKEMYARVAAYDQLLGLTNYSPLDGAFHLLFRDADMPLGEWEERSAFAGMLLEHAFRLLNIVDYPADIGGAAYAFLEGDRRDIARCVADGHRWPRYGHRLIDGELRTLNAVILAASDRSSMIDPSAEMLGVALRLVAMAVGMISVTEEIAKPTMSDIVRHFERHMSQREAMLAS